MAQTGTVKEKSRQCCMPVVLTGMFRDAQAWQMYSVENGGSQLSFVVQDRIGGDGKGN